MCPTHRSSSIPIICSASWTLLSYGLQLVPVFARSTYGQTHTEMSLWSCFVSSDHIQEKTPTLQTKKKGKKQL